jgi:hypothetical protein
MFRLFFCGTMTAAPMYLARLWDRGNMVRTSSGDGKQWWDVPLAP